MTWGCVRRLLLALAPAALASTAFAPAVFAHWAKPEEVIAVLQAPAVRERFGITQVSRDAKLPRLLLIRVDARWDSVAAEQRRQSAEEWEHLWRSSVAQGIVAVVDDATGKTRLSFDAHGRARLDNEPPAAPAGGPTSEGDRR